MILKCGLLYVANKLLFILACATLQSAPHIFLYILELLHNHVISQNPRWTHDTSGLPSKLPTAFEHSSYFCLWK